MRDKSFKQKILTEKLFTDNREKNYRRVLRTRSALRPFGSRLTASGLENVDPSQPTIVTGNHPLGPMDPIIMSHFYRKLGIYLPFVYKEEFNNNPDLKEILEKLGALAMNQDMQSTDQVRRILNAAKSGPLGIFSYQGTTPLDHVPVPEEGPMWFASIADVPLQPVGIYAEHQHIRDDSRDPQETKASIKKSILQPIHLHIQPVINLGGIKKRDQDKDAWAEKHDELHQSLTTARDIAEEHIRRNHGNQP